MKGRQECLFSESPLHSRWAVTVGSALQWSLKVVLQCTDKGNGQKYICKKPSWPWAAGNMIVGLDVVLLLKVLPGTEED